MPENVFVLPSHVVHHLSEYSSLKIIFPLKALPLYFLAPIVVDNSDVKISQFFCRQSFFFSFEGFKLFLLLFYQDVSEFLFCFFVHITWQLVGSFNSRNRFFQLRGSFLLCTSLFPPLCFLCAFP